MAQRTEIRYIQYYTDGSAARKIAPLAPLKTFKLPKVKKQKHHTVCVDPLAIASIGMAVVMAILIVVGTVQLYHARQEMYTMSAYVDTLQDQNASLQQKFSEKCGDLAKLEQTALALGFIPKEQAKHITIELPEIAEPVEPTAWERFATFLTGLFA